MNESLVLKTGSRRSHSLSPRGKSTPIGANPAEAKARSFRRESMMVDDDDEFLSEVADTVERQLNHQ
jgi:hypothetical protein